MNVLKRECDIKIDKRLGGGAFGDVYSGREKKHFKQELVAVKKLKKFFEQDVLEVLAVSFLVHPRIVHIRDILNNDKCLGKKDFGFTMDLLNSTSLNDLIDKGWSYSERTTTRLIFELCDTLAWIHAVGILHMDIKPSNILVVNPMTRPSIKYIDFGGVKICFDLDNMTLSPKRITFTRAYAPPELDNMDPIVVSDKFDVYALGTTIAEILLGPLEEKPHLLDLSSAIINKDLLHLIQGMTAVNPKKRLRMNEVMQSPLFRGQRSYIRKGRLIEPKTAITSNTASFWDYYKPIRSLSVYALVQMIDIFYLILPYVDINKKHVTFHDEKMTTADYMNAITTLARILTSDPELPDNIKTVSYEFIYIIKMFKGRVFRVTWNYAVKTTSQMAYCLQHFTSSFNVYTSNRILKSESLPKTIRKGRLITNVTRVDDL